MTEPRYQTWNSTASTYVIDTEKNKHVDLFWGGPAQLWFPGENYASAQAAEEAAKVRADWLNAHPDELHVDDVEPDPYQGKRLIRRIPVPKGVTVSNMIAPHTMGDCEYGVPQP